MTYLDILSDSISHFTNIPKDFVAQYITGAMKKSDSGSRLLSMLLRLNLSEREGTLISERLKAQSLSGAISFMAGMMNHIKNETERQSLLN